MPTLDQTMKALLAGRRYAILATVNRDNSMHLTPVWYLFENNCLFVTSFLASRKVRNIIANPQVSLIVDVRKPGAEKWVYASGNAELIRGEESEKINAEVFKRYVTAAALEDARVGPVFHETHDITIRIAPRAWRSFDAQPGFYQPFFVGIPTATLEQWFLPLEA